jgi:hypothetical protein
VAPDGDWHIIIDSPVGKQQVLVSLATDGDRLTGTLVNLANNVSTDIFEGTANGGDLRWKVRMQQLKMTLTFTMSVAGGTISGKVKAGIFGHFAATGERCGRDDAL